MSAKRTLSLAFESRIRLFTGQVLLLRLCRLDEKCNDYQMYPHPRFLPLTAGRRSCSWRLEVFSVKISSQSFHSIPPVSTTFVYGDDGYSNSDNSDDWYKAVQAQTWAPPDLKPSAFRHYHCQLRADAAANNFGVLFNCVDYVYCTVLVFFLFYRSVLAKAAHRDPGDPTQFDLGASLNSNNNWDNSWLTSEFNVLFLPSLFLAFKWCLKHVLSDLGVAPIVECWSKYSQNRPDSISIPF